MLATVFVSLAAWTLVDDIVDNRAIVLTLRQHEHPILSAVLRRVAPDFQSRREMLFLAMLGATIATSLGVSASIATRRMGLGAVILVVTPWIGFASGTAAAIGANRTADVYDWMEAVVDKQDAIDRLKLQRAMLIQAANWSLMAAGVGVSVSIALHGQVRIWEPIKGALVGGIIAAVLYPIVGAILFPLESTESLIPSDPGSRLIWVPLETFFMAVGICRCVASHDPKPQSDPSK